MKTRNTFLFTTILTACLSFAGLMIHAGSGEADGRLATPIGIAILRSCELKGEIVEKEDGIYARFTTTNQDEKEIAFSYAVSYLAAAHPFSRMMRMPETIKQGRCTIVLNGAGEQVETILLQAKTPEAATPKTAALPATAALEVPAALKVAPLALGKATWTLAVSRAEKVNAAGWAAVPPPTVLKKTELAEGAVVLATSVMDVKLPAPS